MKWINKRLTLEDAVSAFYKNEKKYKELIEKTDKMGKELELIRIALNLR